MAQYRSEGTIISSSIAPGISVIAPAFNEEVTVIPSVKSLLTLNYPLFEVIIVNDGSKDDTLAVLIKEFSLEKIEYAYNPILKTQPINGVYKSTQQAYSKLIVIDKVNGRCKADASNAGLNVASYPYFLNTDMDCVLDNKTLITMMKPILEEKDQVIAVGAGLRIANSCEIDSGMINTVKPPSRLLPRFQELEYIRSFTMGKMGWSRINAVPNVSGGLGLFDKQVAMEVQGYDPNSFAEDMDLVVKMVKNQIEKDKKYSVRYVPETLCWTEGPETLDVFIRQRVRWARGLWQIFSTHSKVLFNPSYKRMGLLVFPYNFIFELLAPIIEICGIMYLLYHALTGSLNWFSILVFMSFVYIFMAFITIVSVLWDQIVFKQYKTWKEVLGLSLMALIEPVLYHPLILFSSLKGYFYQLIGVKHKWGNMKRKGFQTTVTITKSNATNTTILNESI